VGVVVQNHVHLKVFRYLLVHGAQKLQELLVAVAVQALTDHGPVQNVEGSEERGGAVPLVVIGHRARPTLGHRQ